MKFCIDQSLFHVKSEWMKNLWISTLCLGVNHSMMSKDDHRVFGVESRHFEENFSSSKSNGTSRRRVVKISRWQSDRL